MDDVKHHKYYRDINITAQTVSWESCTFSTIILCVLKYWRDVSRSFKSLDIRMVFYFFPNVVLFPNKNFDWLLICIANVKDVHNINCRRTRSPDFAVLAIPSDFDFYLLYEFIEFGHRLTIVASTWNNLWMQN